MNRTEFLAKLALEQLKTQGMSVSPDMLELALYYVNAAIAILKGKSSYDPLLYANDLANEAIIQYVIAKMKGEPLEGNTAFNAAAQVWSSKAAIDYKYSQ